MKVLLVRHGIAEDGSLDGRDESRALTQEGQAKMQASAGGLAVMLGKLDRIIASPLVRAVQTAEILRNEFNVAIVEELPALAPEGDPHLVLNSLFSFPPEGEIALVGHLPSISLLAGLMLVGQPREYLEFKKGSAALIEFIALPKAGQGILRWHLPPRVSRGLG